MASTTQLDIKLSGLGQVIASGRHSVPIYQRSYAWKESHVEELLDDIAAAIHSEDDEYFLGSIVLTNSESDQPDVVDGQQRLATTVILLATIRNYLIANEQELKANEITRMYLSSRDLRTDELEPRLKLNSVDNDFFVDNVVANPNEKQHLNAVLESHRRIESASNICIKRIESVANAAGSKCIEALIDWVDFIHKNAKVICVSVPSDANAFTIFETLNDRGLALAITDLLKNYLFSKAGNRLNEVQEKWVSMSSILESIGGDEIVVDYVRHLWSAQNGLAREKQLYKEIRKKVNTGQKCVNFVTELQTHAKTYCALFSPGHMFWKTYGDIARSYIFAINMLQTRESLPLLLAIASKFKAQETIKAFRLLVSCTVRSLVVSGRGGILEKQYSAIARQIFSGQIKKESELRKQLSEIIPGDESFKESFSTASSSNGQRARYFLREIESFLNTEEPEWIPSASVDDVSLEHVLPLSLSGDWHEFDEEKHRAFVRRLGNLAILSSVDNSGIGNSSFTTKKKVFAKSSFKTTSDLAKEKDWTPETIASRQQKLAEFAVKTWPLSGERRKPFKKSKVKNEAPKKGAKKKNVAKSKPKIGKKTPKRKK